ncbi:tyrosine-type recombinase/integrase [Nonomuraea turcica]|uniref:tyrosine-type recombinase/integrase n=1 Tax=Nonomuraea sp. G32 TaxID=3067274 RepID=UPI00273CBD22|nr:tyrosine-type recombinase/integrase [Nonomuraea sp. G32]MDP4501051.1 tyrosine-type recombinase/integrase [Nonomuraea sp. G32]
MTDVLPALIEDHLPALPIARPDDRNPYRAYIDSLPREESKRTMAGCLRRLADIMDYDPNRPEDVPWEHLRYEYTTRIRAILAEQTTTRNGETVPWSPSSINKHLSALRGVLKAAWRLGLIPTDDYHRAIDIPGDKGTRLPAGRSIAHGELAAMLAACPGDTLIGIRNAAIIATLAATGARRAELAAARREHYDPGQRSLRIIGKGNKQREVYLSEDAAVYLGRWLAKHDATTGPLFCPVNRWATIVRRHLTDHSIAEVINTARQDAGLPRLTAHDFRRTFIGELLDAGVDLATTQALVGHSSPSTTGRYDRRPAAARKAAAELIRMPRPEDL